MFKPFIPILAVTTLMTACSPSHKAEAQNSASSAASDQASAAIAPRAQAAAATPSFDCAKATLKAETAVCADPRLAQLDVEVTRIYDLIGKAPGVDRAALQRQKGIWLNKRNTCATTNNIETCLLNVYAGRIGDLRAGYPVARADTAVSIGPIVWRCPGASDLSTTFINGETSMAYVKWADKSAVLTQNLSASGARYAITLPEGDYEFWTKGDETMWTAPGSTTMTCTEQKQ